MANKYEVLSDKILKTSGSGAGLFASVNSAFVPGVPNANVGATDYRDAGINLFNSAVSLAELLKKLPVLASAGALVSLTNNLAKASGEIEAGQLSRSTQLGLLSDVLALSGLVLAVTTAGTLASPVAVSAGILLATFSVGSTIYSSMLGVADKQTEANIAGSANTILESLGRFPELAWSLSDDKKIKEIRTDTPLQYPALQLLHFLSPSLTLAQAQEIINASASGQGLSGGKLSELAATLNGIRRMIGLAPATIQNSDQYLPALEQTFAQASNLIGTVKLEAWPQTAATIEALAQSNASVRASMVAGLPFMVTQGSVAGVDATQASQFDSATGQGALTARWLRDRSLYLAVQGKSNALNNPIGLDGVMLVNGGVSENLQFIDEATGNRLTATIGPGATGPLTQIRFGSTGTDVLQGSTDADRLYGGAGNDFLIGGGGNDYLEGGAGKDDYQFAGSFGQDTILDTDGQGSLQINGQAVSGTFKGIGQRGAYALKLADGSAIGLAIYDDSTSTTGKSAVLKVSGSDASSITIKNFNFEAAISTEPFVTIGGVLATNNGYLGIKLAPEQKLALTQGNGTSVGASSANVWADRNFNEALLIGNTTTVAEGGGKSFTIGLARSAQAGDTITLALNGAVSGSFKAVLGDTTVDANGAVITLKEGQTQVSFALISDSAISADQAGSISATYSGQNLGAGTGGTAQTAVSNSFGVNLINSPDAADATNTLTGDKQFTQTLAGITTDVATPTQLDGQGRFAVSSQVLAGAADVLRGTLDNDLIEGLSGNDVLLGMAGNDILNGGPGSDLINGGMGADVINGGDGDDVINGSDSENWVQFAKIAAELTSARLTGSSSNWLFGTGLGSIAASGTGWILRHELDAEGRPSKFQLRSSYEFIGISNSTGQRLSYYLDGDGGLDTLKDDEGNTIDAGAGNDIVLAGTGSDRVNAGTGNDVVWGLAGNDSITGGDGNDQLQGDGSVQQNLIGRTALADHGADFLDGGAGDDELTGGGNSDVLIGGYGADKLFGDGAVEDVPEAIHGADFLDGGEGNDILVGQGGGDQLFGGTGDDTLIGDDNSGNLPTSAHGQDYLDGEDGNDYLQGGGKADVLYGGAGNDELLGDAGTNVLLSSDEQGEDYLDGGTGDDLLIGGGKADTLYGGDGNDELDGDDDGITAAADHGNDYLDGGAGDDLLVGNGKDDILLGGTGNDELQGDANTTSLAGQFHGNDYLDGGAGNDILIGGGKDDTLLGGEGDDQLQGDAGTGSIAGEFHGNDMLDGGAGNDVLIGQGGSDVLQGGDGNDNLYGDEAQDTGLALQYQGNDTLDGGAGDDQLVGGGGDDLLMGGTGNDKLFGGLGRDTLQGGDGNDQLTGDNSQNETEGDADTLDGGAGKDLLFGGAGNDMLDGGEGSDQLTGGMGDDTLDGGAGDDLLQGSEGNDILRGGDGNDSYVYRAGWGIDTIEDLGGEDTLYLSSWADLSSLRLGLGSLKIFTNTPGEEIHIANFDPQDPYGSGTIERFVLSNGRVYTYAELLDALPLEQNGTAGDDVIFGTPLKDWISGGDGNDTITGGASNDKLDGGNGNDSLDGGAGDDTLTGGDGADVLMGGEGNNLLDGGSGDDVITAGDGNNTLLGGAGNDTLSVGAGNNTLNGGDGNDSLTAGAGNDVLTGGAGDDVLNAGNGNNQLDGGDGADQLTSGDGADTLIGGQGNDRLDAGGGNDVLRGGDGNDELLGGAGNDQLFGDAGIDTLRGSMGDDVYNLMDAGDGSDLVVELANEGNDQVNASVNYTLTANVERLNLQGNAALAGTGNELNNEINGNAGDNVLLGLAGNDRLNGGAGNDVLDGGTGADMMIGGSGDDSYVVDDTADQVIEIRDDWSFSTPYTLVSGGYDKVSSSVSYNLGTGIEALRLTGTADINGAGNVLSNTITGNSGNNILTAFQVNGAFEQTRTPGSVVTTNFAASGVLFDDTPRNALAERIGDHLYNLRLTTNSAGGPIAISPNGLNVTQTINIADVVGDTLDGGAGDDQLWGDIQVDTLIGGAGNDLLVGYLGADTLIGGMGDDTYVVDDRVQNITVGATEFNADTTTTTRWTYTNAKADQLLENANEGIDTVVALSDYTLADNFENLTLADGFANSYRAGFLYERQGALDDYTVGQGIYGTGNSANNVIIGNRLDNVLDGRAGADTMAGGQGNDTYVVDNVADVVREQAGEGTDTVQTALDSYVLGANLENLRQTGAANLTGTGNELDNLLQGNDGDNTLYGLDGNDRLEGGAGSDRLDGGNGNDVLMGSAGVDTLIGGQGDDLLDGGTGIDSLTGGAGDDTYIVDNTQDVILELSGEGRDKVEATASYALSTNVEDLLLRDSLNTSNVASSLSGTGNALDNTITGGFGNNTLEGLDGNDTIDGGAGIDRMLGGNGDDTYFADQSGDVVIELAGQGYDTVIASSANYALSDNVEALNLVRTGVNQFDVRNSMAQNSIGRGNALDNRINGSVLANTLYGGAGNDTMDGKGGNDKLYGEDGDDVMLGGADEIYSYQEIASQFYGGTISNFQELSPNDDYLDGGAGNDTIDGGSGNDTILGGAGNDRLFGGADGLVSVSDPQLNLVPAYNANGSFIGFKPNPNASTTPIRRFNTNDDIIDGGAGDDYIDGGSGNDILYGGDGDDDMYGGDNGPLNTTYNGADYYGGNNDIFYGGYGIDKMTGGFGNDTFIVDGIATLNPGGQQVALNLCDSDSRFGFDRAAIYTWKTDTVIELAGQGDDTVFATASVDLRNSEVESVYLQDMAGPERNIDASTGIGNQYLIGNSSNNRLDGGAGADYMSGGLGDDTYVVDDIDDTAFERAGQGQDTVRTTLDAYVLGADLENLVLDGAANLSGSGNALDNVLIGNGGDNTLDGGDGNDTLAGWRGNDVLRGGAGNDTYVIARGDGNDVIDDNQGASRLHFSADISASQLTYEKVGNDLLIKVANGDAVTGATVTIRNWIGATERVDLITFCNGTSVALTDSVVTPVNRAPVAAADTANAVEDGPVVTGNVLSNDTDPDAGDTLSVQTPGTKAGSYGSLQLGATGAYTYTLNNAANNVQSLALGQIVSETFAYTVQDSKGATATSQLTVQITGTNDAPILVTAQPDVSVNAGAPMSIALPTGMFTDIDQGDVLMYGAKLADGSALPSWLTFNASTQTLSGIAPSATAAQAFDVSFTATDKAGDSAVDTVRINVAAMPPVNKPPVAVADTANAVEDGPAVTGNVLTNDTDPDAGDTLSVQAPGAKTGTYGSLLLGATGAYTYALNNAANNVQSLAMGQTVSENFAYTVQDSKGATATSQLTVQITGANDSPILVTAQPDVSVTAGATVSIALPTGMFTDIDQGDVLTYSAKLANGNALPSWLTFNASTKTLSGTAPNATSAQAIDVSFTATDKTGASATDTVRINVGAIPATNKPPLAVADCANAVEDGSAVTGNLLSNDRDPDVGDTLSVQSPGTRQGTYGSLQVAASGAYTYTLNNSAANVQALAQGQSVTDIFAYTVQDNKGAPATSQLTVQIAGANDAPILVTAQPDVSVKAGAALSIALPTGMFTDIDQGDVLTYSAKLANGSALPSWLTFNASTKTLSGTAPNATSAQAIDVSFTATDKAGATAVDTVRITVAALPPINKPPVASADTANAVEDGPVVSGNVLANDTDPDAGDTLRVQAPGTKAGTYGSLQLGATGAYTYTLNNAANNVQSLALGQTVSETFAYTAQDSKGATATSQLTVQITGTNDAPVLAAAQPDVAVKAGAAVTIALPTSMFTDIDQGDVLTYTAKLANGSALPSWLTFNASTKTLSGTAPSAAAAQAIDVSFTATDKAGASAVDMVRINVSAMPTTGVSLTGGIGNDTLTGTNFADRLDGGKGDDCLTGGLGDDLYVVDSYTACASDDDEHDDDDHEEEHDDDCDESCVTGGDKVIELANGGVDTVAASVSYVLPQFVENLMLTGTKSLTGTGNSLNNVIVANSAATTLYGLGGNDILVGRGGADTLMGGDGNDRLYGQDGNDLIDGGVGNDQLWGGTGNDTLIGGGGADLAASGAGDDTITMGADADIVVAGLGNDAVSTLAGNDFIDAGAGADNIKAGAGSDFIAGGTGNDTIEAGAGTDIIVFNKGDGRDILLATGSDGQGDVISLGGGIRYADLSLKRSGQDLVVGLGGTDQITMKDWYASPANRSVGSLQVLTEGGEYNAQSTDRLLKNKAAVFDFAALVSKFDTARQANPNLASWSLNSSLSTTALETSNTQARGGNLAYRYAREYGIAGSYGADLNEQTVRGLMTGMTVGSSQTFSSAPASTQGANTGGFVNPWLALQAGTDLVLSPTAIASNPIVTVESAAADVLLFSALSSGGANNPKPSWLV